MEEMQTIDTQLTPIDECPHPKLGSWRDILSGDYCYQCTWCGKGVNVPMRDIVLEADRTHISLHMSNLAIRDKVAGIVGMTFGEQWQARVLADFNRWEDDQKHGKTFFEE